MLDLIYINKKSQKSNQVPELQSNMVEEQNDFSSNSTVLAAITTRLQAYGNGRKIVSIDQIQMHQVEHATKSVQLQAVASTFVVIGALQRLFGHVAILVTAIQ